MRSILHCDLNNFYASVECRNHKELQGLPVAVCGDPQDRHGIILAKNELAKAQGVRTGETIWQAHLKCPQLQMVRAHLDDYILESRLIQQIYAEYTDQVEPFGIDECWLDVTGSQKLFGQGVEIANRIREQVKEKRQLTISVGVSFNKVFAKLGSDLKKPDAVTELTPKEIPTRIWPLPAQELIGVGGATLRKLSEAGILTIGDLAKTEQKFLKRLLGKNGETLWTFANGYEHSPVARFGDRPPVKSVGNSITCVRDLINEEEVWRVLLTMADEVARRMREKYLIAQTITMVLKDAQLHAQEHTRQMEVSTDSGLQMARCAMRLFRERYDWRHPVRAVGIRASNLLPGQSGTQLNLFAEQGERLERIERLEGRMDALDARYGKPVIYRAAMLLPSYLPAHRPKEEYQLPGFTL